MAGVQRNWTEVGREHTDGNREFIGEFFDRMQWQELGTGGIEAPMMPGEGIKSMIRELRIPKVSRVAWSNDMAPYGLYGVEGNYTNGQARVYAVDEGSRLVVLCSDFWPKEGAAC